MTKGYEIKVEYDATLEDQILEGNLIDTVELNKIGRNGGELIYCMNIMDENNMVYMWFKANDNTNYFVEIKH